VSHNLTAVAALCQRGIYLKGGQLIMNDTAAKTLEFYRSDMAVSVTAPQEAQRRSGTGSHGIESVAPAVQPFPAREPLVFRVKIRRHHEDSPFHFSFIVRNEWEVEALSFTTEHLADGLLKEGDHEFEVTIRSPWLTPGEYRAEAFLYSGGIIDHWPSACTFSVGVDVAKNGFSHTVPTDEDRTLLTDFSIRSF
jgi:lipopolysaccharide transport system ATP-binding protein